jgi:hypothetical protein
MAAWSILVLHLAVIAFNVVGCMLIPLGAWRGWGWVRACWWRLAHLLSLAVVALQAAFGRACMLTIWQAELTGQTPAQPLLAGWIDRLVYWPLPLWVFAVAYALVFAYVAALWFLVPVRPCRSGQGGER